MNTFRQVVSRVRSRGPAPDEQPQPARPGGRWHSVSSCRTYLLCPRRYRYQYVDRTPALRPVPVAWRFGTVVHRALEAAYRHVQAGGSLAGAIEPARAALSAAWHDEDMPDDPDWKARAEAVVAATLEGDTLGPGEVLGVEERFRESLPGDLRFIGFADLVVRRDDGAVEIIDHKVTRSVRTEAELAGDEQLNLYGWFARRRWPETAEVRATLHYPLVGTTVTTTLDPSSMDAAIERLAAVARMAEADRELAPKPGEHCGHCPWSDLCEASAA